MNAKPVTLPAIALLCLMLAGCGESTRTPVPEEVPPAAVAAPAPEVVTIDSNDIGGVVTSSAGPEAGVWVIAETDEFDTFFARIVVTDEQGRYVIPDLLAADYQVWVRGYGLVDSPRLPARPGAMLNL